MNMPTMMYHSQIAGPHLLSTHPNADFKTSSLSTGPPFAQPVFLVHTCQPILGEAFPADEICGEDGWRSDHRCKGGIIELRERHLGGRSLHFFPVHTSTLIMTCESSTLHSPVYIIPMTMPINVHHRLLLQPDYPSCVKRGSTIWYPLIQGPFDKYLWRDNTIITRGGTNTVGRIYLYTMIIPTNT